MRISTLARPVLGAALLVAIAGGAVHAQESTTEPNNAVERQMRAVQAGEHSLPSFIETLVDADIVLLSKRNVVSVTTPRDIPALVVPGEDGDGRNLAVFTSPELAQQVAETYPEYRFGVETDFIWVLAHAAPGLGVAINPGWTLGMEIPSYGVLQMREQYRDRIDARLE